MRPADARGFAVALDKLFSFAQAFGLPVKDMKAAGEFYRSGLAHVPADLVSIAVDRAIADHRWGNRLPLPADLIGLIQSELDDRRAVLIRLESIDRQARRTARYASDEPEPARDPDAVARIVAGLAERLRAPA